MRTYKHLHQKGPFGVFLQKLEASSDPEIINVVKRFQDETFVNETFFRQVAGRKRKPVIRSELLSLQVGSNCRFADDKVYKQPEGCKSYEQDSAGGQAVPDDLTLCQRNTLLNYYLFKQMSRRKKKKCSRVFRTRYDVPLTNGFCKQYLAVSKPEKFRKTSFLLWLNAYLKDKVSTEFLRLSSFEIALKAGDAWNTLPNEEKRKWYRLLNQDLHRKKF